MARLTDLTARRAVEMLKRGDVSPLEMIDAAEERIGEVEGDINALPTLCLDRGREQAKRLMAQGRDHRPDHFLHGLPIAVKDLDDVEGVRTTYGSPIFAHNIPDRSDIMVQTLEAAGAVVIAKSNTPEFGAGSNTFNEVFGATVTPWDTSRTCGGSSGGSAAALAAGEVWLATGSDLGGSLRIPASYCSVVGLRPSPGRVATGPSPLPFQTMSVNGPMGRDVTDTALMLDAMVGRHPGDALSLDLPAGSYLKAVDEPVKPQRIGFSPDLGIAPLDPAVRSHFESVIDVWSDMGVETVPGCPDLSESIDIFHVIRAGMFAATKAALLETDRDKLKPEVIWNIEQGLELTPERIGWAETRRGALYQSTLDFFGEHDLLICPTVIAPPFDVTIRWLDEVDGTRFTTYVDWLVLTMVLTLTACPAISVPAGFTTGGLPLGLQILAPPRREDLLLGAARLFEEAVDLDRITPIAPLPPK